MRPIAWNNTIICIENMCGGKPGGKSRQIGKTFEELNDVPNQDFTENN